MMVRDRMRRDPITVAETDDLATALQLMLWNGIRHLPVLRDGRLVGLLSERDILRQHDPQSPSWMLDGLIADAMTRDVQITFPKEALENAAARMSTHKVGCLPVIDAGAVVGMLTTIDLLAELAWSPVQAERAVDPRAADLMTRDPLTAHPDDRLVDAAARMAQNGFRHLPVIDGDSVVIGILSDRDLRSALGHPNAWLEEATEERLGSLRVGDCMTPIPRTVAADTPVEQIMALLIDERIGAVPVIDGAGRLLGIVSYLDVLRLAAVGSEGRPPRPRIFTGNGRVSSNR